MLDPVRVSPAKHKFRRVRVSGLPTANCGRHPVAILGATTPLRPRPVAPLAAPREEGRQDR